MNRIKMYLLLLMGLVMLPANSVYSMDSLKGAQSSQTKTTQTGLFKKLIAAYPAAFAPANAPFDMATLPDILLLAKAVQPKQGKGKKSVYADLIKDKTGIAINSYDDMGGVDELIGDLKYILLGAPLRRAADQLRLVNDGFLKNALTPKKHKELVTYLQTLVARERPVSADEATAYDGRYFGTDIKASHNERLITRFITELDAYDRTVLFDMDRLKVILYSAEELIKNPEYDENRIRTRILNVTGVTITSQNNPFMMSTKEFLAHLDYLLNDRYLAGNRLAFLDKNEKFKAHLAPTKLTALREYLLRRRALPELPVEPAEPVAPKKPTEPEHRDIIISGNEEAAEKVDVEIIVDPKITQLNQLLAAYKTSLSQSELPFDMNELPNLLTQVNTFYQQSNKENIPAVNSLVKNATGLANTINYDSKENMGLLIDTINYYLDLGRNNENAQANLNYLQSANEDATTFRNDCLTPAKLAELIAYLKRKVAEQQKGAAAGPAKPDDTIPGGTTPANTSSSLTQPDNYDGPDDAFEEYDDEDTNPKLPSRQNSTDLDAIDEAIPEELVASAKKAPVTFPEEQPTHNQAGKMKPGEAATDAAQAALDAATGQLAKNSSSTTEAQQVATFLQENPAAGNLVITSANFVNMLHQMPEGIPLTFTINAPDIFPSTTQQPATPRSLSNGDSASALQGPADPLAGGSFGAITLANTSSSKTPDSIFNAAAEAVEITTAFTNWIRSGFNPMPLSTVPTGRIPRLSIEPTIRPNVTMIGVKVGNELRFSMTSDKAGKIPIQNVGAITLQASRVASIVDQLQPLLQNKSALQWPSATSKDRLALATLLQTTTKDTFKAHNNWQKAVEGFPVGQPRNPKDTIQNTSRFNSTRSDRAGSAADNGNASANSLIVVPVDFQSQPSESNSTPGAGPASYGGRGQQTAPLSPATVLGAMGQALLNAAAQSPAAKSTLNFLKK